jgi:hypothetical protein
VTFCAEDHNICVAVTERIRDCITVQLSIGFTPYAGHQQVRHGPLPARTTRGRWSRLIAQKLELHLMRYEQADADEKQVDTILEVCNAAAKRV